MLSKVSNSHLAAHLDVGVVILSCDKYSDLWRTFFRTFFEFWPDCPFPVYLVANEKTFPHQRVKTLLSGEDTDWSSSVRRCVKDLPHSHLLFWVDDAFLCETVDTRKVIEIMTQSQKLNANYCRFRRVPAPKTWIDSNLGELTENDAYRTALFGSLWKKDIFLELLKDGESAWQFELKGSERSVSYSRFFSIRHDVFPHLHGVERGLWIRPIAFHLLKQGHPLDLNYRRVMSVKENIGLHYRKFKSFVLEMAPPEYRKPILSGVQKFYKLIGVR